jgi:Ion transport protein
MTKMIRELIIFVGYYLSVLFIYSIVGVVLFNDLPLFNNLPEAMFTLFRATIKDYDIYAMQGCRVGDIIGYIYFNSYLILNITLLVNLIVA